MIDNIPAEECTHYHLNMLEIHKILMFIGNLDQLMYVFYIDLQQNHVQCLSQKQKDNCGTIKLVLQ